MRLNINLASRPYEDVRQFLLRWSAALLVLAIITGGLVYFAVSNWKASKDVNADIQRLKQDIARLDREKAAAIETLNQPDNKTIANQSRFLNQAFAQKSMSWTHVFMDLERMMPPRLHLVSIAPDLTHMGQMQLHLMVAGDSHDKAVELVRRMETSPRFRGAQIRGETMVPANAGPPTDRVQFEITSFYQPGETPAAPEKPAGKGSAKAAAGGGM